MSTTQPLQGAAHNVAGAAPAHRSPGRPRSATADQAIIDAIVDLLVEGGYREVTIEGVAQRAGVAKTTIYRRWPSKAGMVVEAIAACKKECLVEDQACSRGTVACSLERMLSTLSSSRVARILSSLTVEMAHNEELAVAVREGLLKPNRQVVISLLQSGITSGEIRPDVNVELVADLLVGPIFFRLLVSGDEIGPEVASAVVDLVVRGIARSVSV